MYLYAERHISNPGVARLQYMRQGSRISSTFHRIASWCFRDELGSLRVLDFASGHGRVTRYLAPLFGTDNVWVADIQQEAVDFCRSTLGVQGFYSTTLASDLATDERFDFIVVSSLFSHLPRTSFRAWLARLAAIMTPSGVLAFSVHGRDMVDPKLFPADGHLMVAESESLALDPAEYGTAYVSDEFVQAEIRLTFASPVFVRLLRKGLCGTQDVYVVSRDEQRLVLDLPDMAEPVGYVDHCALDADGQLRVMGWAASLDSADPLDCIAVEVDGVLIATSASQIRRGDVAKVLGRPSLEKCGFDVQIGVHPPFTSDRFLEIKGCTSGGLREQLFVAPLSDLRMS